MRHRQLMSLGRYVGDQPAVTTPPQSFAAPDHLRVPSHDVKQIRKSGSKLLSSGVRRVCPEGGHSPPSVDRCVASREMPSTAEALIPSVFDPSRRKPPFQRFTVHVRIPAAARIAAYVDDYLDSGIVQHLLERGPVQRPVPDGQQWHPSIVPRAG